MIELLLKELEELLDDLDNETDPIKVKFIEDAIDNVKGEIEEYHVE